MDNKKDNKISKFAKISLTFGILGLITSLFYGGILGIIGLVYGVFVLIDKMEGKRAAIIGITTSVLAVLITATVVHVGSAAMRSGMYDEELQQIYEQLEPYMQQ